MSHSIGTNTTASKPGPRKPVVRRSTPAPRPLAEADSTAVAA